MYRIEHRPPSPGKVCAFTGHRPSKYGFLGEEESDEYNRVSEIVYYMVCSLIREGFSHFISGGALGSDLLCAMQVIRARESFPGITLELALPCPEHSLKWRDVDARKLEKIKLGTDIITTVCSVYSPFCMNERNRYMVMRCDRLLSVYDGTRGGTRNTIKLALDAGKHGSIIDPRDFSVREF
ncbi:MAG: DUF1273 domain-containing protein [Clostridiales bacterium]|nr:DUF1273 domain-containing protein [Clostridiales bacterium]